MSRLQPVAALLTVAALVLAGCGNDNSAAAPETTAPEETRTVSHEYGEAEVPVDPKRVVVLHNSAVLGTALMLDVPVVGYPAAPFGGGVLPYLDESKLDGARNVAGTFPDPNIEAVAATGPDLIIGTTGFVDEAAYNRLTELAPTVVFEIFGSTPWKDAVREVAAVFGEEERIEQGISRHERRVEDLRAALGQRVENRTVTLANFRALDDIRIIASDWCSSSTLQEVGLVRPPDQRAEEETNLSIELLPQIDADMLIYFVGSTATSPDEAGQARQEIMSNPLWDTLGVVQPGQTYEVDPTHWFTCDTLQAQTLVLDDLERILLEAPR